MFKYLSDLEEEDEKFIMAFEGNSMVSGKDQCIVGGVIKPLPFSFLSF